MIGRGKEKGKLLRFLAGKGKAFLVHELCSLRTVWMLVKKDFSGNKGQSLEGVFLVKELLPDNGRRRAA